MATPSQYAALLGYDPREDERERRKLWAGLYGSASSPYEKIGLGLSQLGGALFDRVMGDESSDPVSQIRKLSNEAGQQFTPRSPEYYRYIAENSQDPTVKSNAAGLYQEAIDKETKKTREDIDFLQKNPDQLASELGVLTDRLNKKARTLGYNPQDPLNAEVPPEIQAKLEQTPEYKKILQLSNAGQNALMERAQKEEKETLGITSLKTTIDLNRQKLADIGDDLKSGQRWNMERDAAIKTLAAAGYAPDAKLEGADKLNTALVSAQKIALRDPFVGGKQSQSNPTKGAVTPEDKQALQFIIDNPKSPDVEAIKKKLKARGVL